MSGEPFRILYVTNRPGPRGCGIAEFGRLQAAALAANGADVKVWEASYPTYLPPTAHTYDVIHLNWHPVTINHILPEHLPKGPLISAHIHESHPHWWEQNNFPVIWPAINERHRYGEEPLPGLVFYQIPIPDYVPRSHPEGAFTVGHTGIRGDGLDHIAPVCERRGWKLSRSESWLPMNEEIERLARCHMVVVQYHGGYSGQSMGVTTAIASLRPILINSNRMLRTLFDEPELYRIEDFEEGADKIYADIVNGKEKRPLRLADKFRWSDRARWLLDRWREDAPNRR